MWCFAVSIGAVHNDSTISVVTFDITGTLKQKVGVVLPASAAPPPKGDLTSRESLKVLAAFHIYKSYNFGRVLHL